MNDDKGIKRGDLVRRDGLLFVVVDIKVTRAVLRDEGGLIEEYAYPLYYNHHNGCIEGCSFSLLEKVT